MIEGDSTDLVFRLRQRSVCWLRQRQVVSGRSFNPSCLIYVITVYLSRSSVLGKLYSKQTGNEK